MSAEPSRLTVVFILLSMVLVLAGVFVVRRIVTHPGWVSTEALVLATRREAGPTTMMRVYDRNTRYIADLRWTDEDGAVHTSTIETGPFDFNKLRVGHPSRALYSLDEPDRVRLHEDATSELFLVVLGVGAIIATFGVIAIGRRLERRVAG